MYFLACNIKDKREEGRIIEYINMHLDFTENINLAEGILILGGDGTVLRTLLTCQMDRTPPIYTINYGSIGALLLCKPDELNAVIYKIQSKKGNFEYLIRKRLYLEQRGFFLNEVILTSKMHGRLNRFSIYVNDELLTNVMGDSVIIATSTGSSAYNLSAGGCVVDNNCDCIILKVVAPFRSRFPGMIFSIDKKLKVVIEKNGKCIVDGVDEYDHNTIEVYYRDNSARFAYNKGECSINKRLFDKNFI